MPFIPILRQRLTDLKFELESGILPQVIYEEMCRQAIAEYGSDAFEAQLNSDNFDMPPQKKSRRYPRQVPAVKLICPECNRELINTQGLSTHLLAKHKRSIDEYVVNPVDGMYIPRPIGWIPPPVMLPPKLRAPDAKPSEYGMINEATVDQNFIQLGDDRTDKRKYNKGSSQRRSYSKDQKLRCIALRDEGKSTDEISEIVQTARSNVEKWCSAKVREAILKEVADSFKPRKYLKAQAQIQAQAQAQVAAVPTALPSAQVLLQRLKSQQQNKKSDNGSDGTALVGSPYGVGDHVIGQGFQAHGMELDDGQVGGSMGSDSDSASDSGSDDDDESNSGNSGTSSHTRQEREGREPAIAAVAVGESDTPLNEGVMISGTVGGGGGGGWQAIGNRKHDKHGSRSKLNTLGDPSANVSSAMANFTATSKGGHGGGSKAASHRYFPQSSSSDPMKAVLRSLDQQSPLVSQFGSNAVNGAGGLTHFPGSGSSSSSMGSAPLGTTVSFPIHSPAAIISSSQFAAQPYQMHSLQQQQQQQSLQQLQQHQIKEDSGKGNGKDMLMNSFRSPPYAMHPNNSIDVPPLTTSAQTSSSPALLPIGNDLSIAGEASGNHTAGASLVDAAAGYPPLPPLATATAPTTTTPTAPVDGPPPQPAPRGRGRPPKEDTFLSSNMVPRIAASATDSLTMAIHALGSKKIITKKQSRSIAASMVRFGGRPPSVGSALGAPASDSDDDEVVLQLLGASRSRRPSHAAIKALQSSHSSIISSSSGGGGAISGGGAVSTYDVGVGVGVASATTAVASSATSALGSMGSAEAVAVQEKGKETDIGSQSSVQDGESVGGGSGSRGFNVGVPVETSASTGSAASMEPSSSSSSSSSSSLMHLASASSSTTPLSGAIASEGKPEPEPEEGAEIDVINI